MQVLNYWTGSCNFLRKIVKEKVITVLDCFCIERMEAILHTQTQQFNGELQRCVYSLYTQLPYASIEPADP